MTEKIFADLTENYVSLRRTGEVKAFAGGDEFWNLPGEELDRIGEDWLVTEFRCEQDWQTWEMHPHAEEIVYLLAGAIDLVLEKDGARRRVELRGKGAVVVPPATWHTAKVFEPSSVLIMTLGKGTEIRPVE